MNTRSLLKLANRFEYLIAVENAAQAATAAAITKFNTEFGNRIQNNIMKIQYGVGNVRYLYVFKITGGGVVVTKINVSAERTGNGKFIEDIEERPSNEESYFPSREYGSFAIETFYQNTVLVTNANMPELRTVLDTVRNK